MGKISTVQATYTRIGGTTQYAANDIIADSATAGSVTALAFPLPTGNGRGMKILGWVLKKSAASVTNADIDVYLFNAQPTSTAADNEAWIASNVMAHNKGAAYVGKLDGGQMIGGSDAAQTTYMLSSPVCFYAAYSVLYGVLVAQAAYTPAANEVFTVDLIIEHVV